MNTNMDTINININEKEILKFQLSDPVWWGYNIDITKQTLLILNSKENIIIYVLDNLESTLNSLNLLP